MRQAAYKISYFILVPLGFVLAMVLMTSTTGYAQNRSCVTLVSSFPYNEGFENGGGNWFDGGTASDWTWGAPAKPVISTAGEGTKSFMTGGLTGSSYNDGENSWLQSPCFDFTSLTDPRISFKIFWETERRFDGAQLQYATSESGPWTTVGDINSNSNCQGQNWYNTPSVTYLGNAVGWSGNVQSSSGSCLGGSGSSGWLNASHSLQNLAGEPLVLFRFVFASGTTCNNFDGFAIDAINIAEAVPNSPSDVTVTRSCLTASNVAFTSTAPCALSVTWDFDDPVSGANNTSTLPNPTHNFLESGVHNVKTIVTYPSGPPVVKTTTVIILDFGGSTTTHISCPGGRDGSIDVVVNGGTGSFSYQWNTIPGQTTEDISNLTSGSYTVVANGTNACAASYTFIVPEPARIVPGVVVQDATCDLANGSINTNTTGGTSPYTYTWSTGATTPSISNLSPGSYDLHITDMRNCSFDSLGIVVKDAPSNLGLELGSNITKCADETIVLRPGTFSSYVWQDNSTGPTFTVTTAGLYHVTVTDAGGCSASDSIIISLGDCSGVYFPTAFTPNGDGRNDGFGPLGNLSGIRKYSLYVFNRYGQRVYFSADPYQKWDGRLLAAKQDPGSFTWISSFELNGKPEQRKGAFILLR